MSQEFERTVGSRLCFSIRGCSTACCKQTLGKRAIYHKPKIVKMISVVWEECCPGDIVKVSISGPP